MKKSLVIGRRIVDVVQHRCTSNCGDPVWSVDHLVLDNGARLILSVVELDEDPCVPEPYGIDAFVSRLTYLKKKPKGHRP